MPKLWKVKAQALSLQARLQSALGISRVLACLLINRNISSPESAHDFLNPGLLNLSPSDLLPDSEKARDRIYQALEKKEKVMVFSDYDADGLTSLAVVKNGFKKMSLAHQHCLGHRLKDGYGLSSGIVKDAHLQGIHLLVTLDCGIGNFKEIEELRRLGIDVIVIDHHQVLGNKLPQAYAIVNPKRGDPGCPDKDLAGVGVSYKFVHYLLGEDVFCDEQLDLVCIGTIADVAPLSGENRIIVKEGLRRLNSTRRAGLKSLIEISGLANKPITSETVSYILSPRLNAAGRIGSADAALSLLLSEDPLEAKACALELQLKNRQRQRIESEIMEAALCRIEGGEIDFSRERVIVLHQDGWHEGVLGIVAAKISDRFNRPAIIISFNNDIGKGSGRSIDNFHLFEGLSECQRHLLGFGGHKRACGLKILKGEIENFKKSMNLIAFQKLSPEDLLPSLAIEVELRLSDLSLDLLEEIKLLEPFGEANPKPLFLTRNLKVKARPNLLGRNTLSFWVTDGKVTYKAIGFRMGSYFDLVSSAAAVDIVYGLSLDVWDGNSSLQLGIEDIRCH